MEGKNKKHTTMTRLIFVSCLVLNLEIMQSEAALSAFEICMASCMPKCISGKPFLRAALCAAGCFMSCIAFDPRITSPSQYSCSLACAQSSNCTNNTPPTSDLTMDKVNSCVDGCITGCVKD